MKATSESAKRRAARPSSRRMRAEQDAPRSTDIEGALTALLDGDFKVRVTPPRRNPEARVARLLNELIERNDTPTEEAARISAAVGRDGRTDARLTIDGARGAWAASRSSLNGMIDALVKPTT